MDASDWAIVLSFSALIPIFVFATIVARRTWPSTGGEGARTSTPPQVLEEQTRRRQLVADVVSNMPGCTAAPDGGLRFVHRGLPGLVALHSDDTEIHVETGDLVQHPVEVIPTGFPLSLLLRRGEERFQVRGLQMEYARIFKSPAEEQVLLEIGVRYTLKLGPEGLFLRLHALPQNGASLRYWMACAFRIVELLPGIESVSRVQVSELVQQIADDTLCQVCGSSLAHGSLVRCAACGTPHHEDCWQYARKCSTFGCTSQRCVA
jgi:Prokaryotic RING finger family 1